MSDDAVTPEDPGSSEPEPTAPETATAAGPGGSVGAPGAETRRPGRGHRTRKLNRYDEPRATFADFYHETTRFRFMRHKRRYALISGAVILVGLIAFAFSGLNLGIDFEGGTSFQFTVKGHAPSVGEARDIMAGFGVNDATIVVVGGNGMRVESKKLKPGEDDAVRQKLASYAGVASSQVTVNEVSPTWGQQISQKALRALIVFFIAIAVYLSLRFEVKMAISALLAVIHDILVTGGVYAITRFEVTPETVIAFLTILGFSLYDTVVVFDKIKENTPKIATARDLTYDAMVDESMNNVLMRSVNTTFVAVLPVASVLFVGAYILGALGLRDFGLALFVGLMTGAYSSLFVATPILSWWKSREPHYRAVAERVAAQGARAERSPRAARVAPAGPAVAVAEASARGAGAVGNGAEGEDDDEMAYASRGAARSDGVTGPPAVGRTEYGRITPRPRQQRGRKRR